MSDRPLFTRRHVLLSGASLPLLAACGGGATSNSAVTADPVYVAEPDASTIVLAQQNATRTWTATFVKTSVTNLTPSTVQVNDGTTQAEMVFDTTGRPILTRDSGRNTRTYWIYPFTNVAIATHYDSAGAVTGSLAIWASAGKYFCGTVSSPAPHVQIPNDVQSPQDITSAVTAVMQSLQTSLAQQTTTTLSLFDLLPFASARAETADADIHQMLRSDALAALASPLPMIVAAQAAVSLNLVAMPATSVTLAALTQLLAAVFKASTLDRSRSTRLTQDYLARPYQGALQAAGFASITSNNPGLPCGGDLSVNAVVSISSLTDTSASLAIDGIEYVLTSCRSTTTRVTLSALSLIRTDDQLAGIYLLASGAALSINLTLSADLGTLHGNMQYIYQNPNNLSGNATALISAHR